MVFNIFGAFDMKNWSCGLSLGDRQEMQYPSKPDAPAKIRCDPLRWRFRLPYRVDYLLPLALVLLIAAGQVQAGGPKLQMFDGKTLDGWKAEGTIERKDPKQPDKTAPIWTVRDGMIHCAGQGFGFLRYDKQEFGDFHFHVEYRFPDPKGRNNSGIGIRTVEFDPKRSKDTRPSYACYEIQLLNDADKEPNAHGTGSLYRYVAPKVKAVKPAPEWNAMDIVCKGPHIVISLNGTEILDFDQTTMDKVKNNPLRGYLCLQNHGSDIEFRNVWVQSLDKK
jgi:hypothetical protein